MALQKHTTLATLPTGAAFGGIFAPNAQINIKIGTNAGIYQNYGSTAVPAWALQSAVLNNNAVLQAPGLEKVSGTPALVTNANQFYVRANGYFSAAVAALTTFPVLAGGNLAFDNGTVPQTTLSCRVYTFIAKVSATTGAVTLSVVNGPDFTKYAPATQAETNIGDGTGAIVGFLYVKNESSAAFVPGTTSLSTSGITATFTDAYGFPIVA